MPGSTQYYSIPYPLSTDTLTASSVAMPISRIDSALAWVDKFVTLHAGVTTDIDLTATNELITFETYNPQTSATVYGKPEDKDHWTNWPRIQNDYIYIPPYFCGTGFVNLNCSLMSDNQNVGLDVAWGNYATTIVSALNYIGGIVGACGSSTGYYQTCYPFVIPRSTTARYYRVLARSTGGGGIIVGGPADSGSFRTTLTLNLCCQINV